MKSVKKELIEYYGINNHQYKDLNSFKQINEDYMFCLPMKKPNIEQITKVWIEVNIIETEIVKTPKGTSLEGQTITGNKLLICGDFNLKIQYVACEPSQGIHTAHTTVPFCDYIVLPEGININTCIKGTVLIEDIFSNQIDSRCIYNNITMLAIADTVS